MWFIRFEVIRPQKSEYITVFSLYCYHQKGLLDVCHKSYTVSAKSQEYVKNFLIEFWSDMEAVVKRWSAASC